MGVRLMSRRRRSPWRRRWRSNPIPNTNPILSPNLGVDDGGREHENVRELVVEVLLVVQGEQLRLDKYSSNRTRERLTSCTWSTVSRPIVPLCARRACHYVRDARANRCGTCTCRLRGVPPRLQQHGGGEGDEAEDGELLEHLLQQLLHGQRRGNQWTLEAAGSST